MAGEGEPELSAPDAEASASAAASASTNAEPDQRYLRLAADFDNFRRRKNQELSDRSRYASEAAASALLPVLDNLRRAVAHAPEAGTEEFLSGLQLVVREFEGALEKLGVVPIDSVGEPFDPALHEAIGSVEDGDVDVDTVADEVQRGYRLHDRVLRPALVRVAHPGSSGQGR